jgi:dipeptidyl aminopeptidase/acylaminoacyl peptidase
MEKHTIDLDEERISAIHLPDESEKWIFICHGFADSKERSMLPLAEKFNDKGFNCVVFDFRGNGESSREFAEANLSTRIKDLKAVIKHFNPEKSVIYGTSFGAKVSLHTIAQTDLANMLVTKAPVTYNPIMDKFRKVIEEDGEAEFYGKTFDMRFYEDLDSYSFEDAAEKIDIPIAMFHGSEDTTVHPENTFRAAQQIDSDVMVQKMKGEKHSFTDKATEEMVEKTVSWIRAEF